MSFSENTINPQAKILYLITRPDLGGAQTHVKDLIEGFSDNYEIHLALGWEGALTEMLKSSGVSVHLLPHLKRPLNLNSDVRAVGETVDLIRQIQPNLIHSHSSKAGIVGRIAGKLTGVPTIFTAHGWGFSSGTPKLRGTIALLAEKLGAMLAEKIICVSDSDCQLALEKGVGDRDSLVTIRYGLHDGNFPLANAALQPPRAIMVARFSEQKDQKTLLQAIAQLQHSQIVLDLVGSGPFLETCKTLARTLRITDRVTFLGDRTDVPQLLARSQIFVLSTHYEGLPISILEAMRAGLPVVATSVNGIPEEVTNRTTGLLVPPKNADALASALDTLANSPELRQQMGTAGRQKFLQDFTLDRMLTEIEAIYEFLLVTDRFWQ
ncbi:MAG: glycosyltransferase family 4 protein [Cyanobacteriota bacterium]|nr:glycosyltransferase family 4 protein [Cyanobacteriota bacterium]